MNKTKNNKVYIYAYAISFIIILLFFSLLVYKKKQSEEITKRNETVKVNKLINSWDYDSAIKSIEDKWSGSLDRDKKLKLLSSYLNYGNYNYKEQEYSKKSIEILDTMENDYSKFYYYWYAKEIIKDYTGALDNYNKWLQINWLTDSQKSLFQNQIWHVYDLKWEFDKVLAYYEEAYKLDNNNDNALSNLWRYYVRIKEFEKAKDYFDKALKLTTNMPLKSEICFSLSSIELELNWLTPDIDKSVEYAKQSIEFYPSYPMGYLALARGLYMKNDAKYDEEIKENLNKTIELNPNWYFAYELFAMYEYDKWNMNEFLSKLQKAESLIQIDMILMDNVRETEKVVLNYKYYVLNELQKNKGSKEKSLSFLDMVMSSSLWKSVLKLQVQRTRNWILWFLSWEKKFKDLTEKLTK